MVAIPTTAGTGSEATQFTIITDTRKDIKMLLKGKVLMPSLAVIDPQFTMTAPPKITAATGLDALCHAVEAYTSNKAQTLSDTFAVSAVKRIFKYLPVAYQDGKNEEARVQMSVAALEAGIAFNNSSVTLIHGMSRPIGALFHVAHGLSNAMLIKVCLGFALEGAYDRFADLGRAVGVAAVEDDDKTAAEKFLAGVIAIVEELNTPTLEECGIDRETFFGVIDKMAHDAMESGSPQNTRKAVTQEDVVQMYKDLWK
jgi:alcohol dehydrogenase class IV